MSLLELIEKQSKLLREINKWVEDASTTIPYNPEEYWQRVDTKWVSVEALKQFSENNFIVSKEAICVFSMYVRSMERLWNEIPNTKVFNPNKTDEGFGDGTYCSLNAYVADFLKACDKVLGWDTKKNAEEILRERGLEEKP